MQFVPMLKTLLSLTILVLFAGCASDASVSEVATNGQSGSITRFVVYGDYMYTLNPNEVQTWSIANEDKPQLLHTLATDYGLETIIIYDETIYIGSRTALYILDISQPATPVLLSQTDRDAFFFGGCDPVVVKDNYAYSTIKIIENVCGSFNSISALLTYDVTDKTNPVVTNEQFLDIPNGLGVQGDYLFVCDEGMDQIVVFDITDPANPQPTEYNVPLTDPVDVIARNGELIVSTKTDFQFYDITDIANIRPLGFISK
ncbi:MAG: hypothetical protein R2795_12305 [Saprospiraceae bacterium]